MNFKIKNLGDSGRIERESEIRKERLELQEFSEDLWRCREGGGGEKKNGTEKKRETTTEDLKKKIQNLDKIVDKEKRESERIRDLTAKENSRLTEEGEKRKIRLEIKRTLQQKWELARWVAKQEEELYEWKLQKEKF